MSDIVLSSALRIHWARRGICGSERAQTRSLIRRTIEAIRQARAHQAAAGGDSAACSELTE